MRLAGDIFDHEGTAATVVTGSATSIVRNRSVLSVLRAHPRTPQPASRLCPPFACPRFFLKQIGDQLGHRRASSTLHYAKLDLHGLREVGELSLGRLL